MMEIPCWSWEIDHPLKSDRHLAREEAVAAAMYRMRVSEYQREWQSTSVASLTRKQSASSSMQHRTSEVYHIALLDSANGGGGCYNSCATGHGI